MDKIKCSAKITLFVNRNFSVSQEFLPANILDRVKLQVDCSKAFKTDGKIMQSSADVCKWVSSFFNSGESGESGTPGRPGKDSILYGFVFSFEQNSCWTWTCYVHLQVLQVQRVSRVKQEQKVKWPNPREFLKLLHLQTCINPSSSAIIQFLFIFLSKFLLITLCCSCRWSRNIRFTGNKRRPRRERNTWTNWCVPELFYTSCIH